METKEWTVRYVAYSGRIVRTTVEAPFDADEGDVKLLALKQESGLYNSDDIHEIIDVE